MSYEKIAKEYDKRVGKEGHYYHKEVILKTLAKTLLFPKDQTHALLDLGCGQGVLREYLPKDIGYVGVDISKTLLASAEKRRKGSFFCYDISTPFSLKEKNFSHITMILSLQNIKDPYVALKNAKDHLAPKGCFYLVINHPCFRIPRQSSWGIEKEKKLQYRRIDRYLSPLSVPIQMDYTSNHKDKTIFSYHHPLSTYINILGDLSLGIVHCEEWTSNKESSGPLAKQENRARKEIPLFMLLVAKHI